MFPENLFYFRLNMFQYPFMPHIGRMYPIDSRLMVIPQRHTRIDEIDILILLHQLFQSSFRCSPFVLFIATTFQVKITRFTYFRL